MTPTELLSGLYQWADQQAGGILGLSLALPVLGTLAARIAKGSPVGERIANLLILSAVALFFLALLLAGLAQSAFKGSLWQANLLLLLSPLALLSGAILGVRLLYPLNRLASVRTLKDIGLMLAACLLVLWLFSQFRGWGILFLGGTLQLLLIGLGLLWLLRRLYRRALEPRDWGI
jgi:hypothetical protein